MNEADVLQAFPEPPLPPSVVDVDRAIRAGRRWRRSRTASIAVAVVGFLAAGTFATVPVLVGGQGTDGQRTQFTIGASAADGGPVSPADLGSAAVIVQNRLRAAGFRGAAVSAVDGHLVAVVAGHHANEEIATQLAPGGFSIRKVIDIVDPSLGGPRSAPLAPWQAAMPQEGKGPRPSQAQVLATLGAAATTAAQSTTSQTEAANNPALEPFRHLSPAEVAVLPLTMQFRVPQIGCQTLNTRPADSVALEPGPVVACDTNGIKYLLDSTKLSNADLASATATRDRRAFVWTVDLRFNAAGAAKLTDLTREAYENSGGACIATEPSYNGTGDVCQVAFVVDNTILTSPSIQGVLTDSAGFSGGTETEARQLAAELSFGRVPFTLTIQDVVSEP